MSVQNYEQEVANVSNQILRQIYPDLMRLTQFGWQANSGANYEGVYNAQGIGANDKPENAQLTQSSMNNVITAFNNLITAIEANSGALAKGADR